MIEHLTLAIYSQLAYEDLDYVRAALPGAKVTLLDRDDTQVYIIETETETVVSIRGTQVTSGFSMTDVLRNAKIRLVLCPIGGRVHYGYKEGVDVIANDLAAALARAKRPLYFVGHSLGGAEVTYARTLYHPEMTVTFGAPKVGNAEFVKAAARYPLVRYSHGRDIAPKHARPWLGGYQHGGEFRKIMRDGKIIVRPWRWYDELILPGDLTRGTFEHRVGEYVEKLRGAEI